MIGASSRDWAIAVANGPVTASGSLLTLDALVGSSARPPAASRESMRTAIAAAPSTAPNWRVAL